MLIKCPECHNSVSNEAISCPFCGYVLRTPDNRDRPIYKSKIHGHGEGCFLQTLNSGCAIIGGLIVFGIIGGILGDAFWPVLIIVGVAIGGWWIYRIISDNDQRNY